MEKWKSIPSFNDRYEVSDRGNVRSWKAGRWEKRNPSPHILSQTKIKKRMIVWLRQRGSSGRWYVSVCRLVAMMFIGPRPDGYCIHHKDGNILNDKLDNLEYIQPPYADLPYKDPPMQGHYTGAPFPGPKGK